MRTPPPLKDSTTGILRTYFALLYAAVFLLMAQFWDFVAPESPLVRLYILASTTAYASLYTLIPLLLMDVLRRLLRIAPLPMPAKSIVLYAIAALLGSLTIACIYADLRLYTLYDYHVNGFVWNLITTPGGIEALGATASTRQTVALLAGLLVAGNVLVLGMLHRLLQARRPLPRGFVMACTGAMLFLLMAEEGVYAYSTYTGKEDFVQAADVIPFHLRTSMSKLYGDLGVERTAMKNLRIASGTVSYPSTVAEASARRTPYPNIIMLVGESFRWDLLDPEITPHLWRFSGQAMRFTQHYSGGNRTRMGLFSMFYGLYSPYWYSFERQRIAPVLMNFLQGHDYQFALHTSQSFDYPELRHTVFTGMPESTMQELKVGEPWQRDRQNITDLIAKLEKRQQERPFFGFMFFESTHAPYTFPAEAAVRPDYEADLNYINMNLVQNIGRIKARYVNAAHHVDQEVGRLLDYLKQHGMLENTIVLFTGDHGEEFMEKGHWGHGHNRSFPEEQLRVPLVLHIPGRPAAVVTQPSSHLQITPTLLEALGVQADAHGYSSMGDLFTPPSYFVAGDYNYMTVFDQSYKITFPFTGSDYFRYTVHDAQDRPVVREDISRIVRQYQPALEAVTQESMRFVR